MDNILEFPRETVRGFFKQFVARMFDDDGNELYSRVLSEGFPNLIVNNGKDLLGTNTGYLSFFSVGTSNTAPAAGQTALIGFLAATSTPQGTPTTVVTPGSPYFVSYTLTRRFAAAPTNWNINEVGVGATTGGTNLLSRALTVDGFGVPTTLTVLTGEVLDVTYELRVYPPIGADVTGTITISGINYNYTIRASLVGSGIGANGGWGALNGAIDVWNTSLAVKARCFPGAIGAITSFPSGTASDVNTGFTDLTYTNGNYYRDHQVVIGLGQGNVSGGILSMSYLFNWGSYQIQFSPVIPKDATKILTLVFRHAWV